MARIELTHTFEDGTRLNVDERLGKEKWRELLDGLRGLGQRWNWWRSLGCFGRTHSEGTLYTQAEADRVVARLAELGHEVAVAAFDQPAELTGDDFAARRQAAAERSSERAEALDAKAGRQDAEAGATLATARQMADAIPLGQPMMPDHHSYRTDRNYRDRMGRKYDKGFEQLGEARETARRADAAAGTVQLINKNDADPGFCQRRIAENAKAVADCDRFLAAPTPAAMPEAKTAAFKEEVRARREGYASKLAHYRGRLEAIYQERPELLAWCKAFVKPGDRIARGGEIRHVVVRANPTTVTCRAVYGGWPPDCDEPRYIFDSPSLTGKVAYGDLADCELWRQVDGAWTDVTPRAEGD